MKFMRFMIYLLIAIMFGLVTASLTDDVQQCDPTIQTLIDDINGTEFLKWLKWARIFSFCRYINSTYDYGCKTHDCKECLAVCRMDNYNRNVMSSCEQNCTTTACKKGCRFYSKVFINSNIQHFTTVEKPFILDQTDMNVSLVINDLNLHWPPVFSGDISKIKSLYLLTKQNYGDYLWTPRGYQDKDKVQILTLTENSRYLVKKKDINCSFLSTFSHYRYGLTFRVIPINFVGPRSYHKQALDHYKARQPDEQHDTGELTVSEPFFKKSVENNFNYIVWEIDWKGSPNSIYGFRVTYSIYTCSIYTNMIEMKKLNPKKIYLVKEKSFRMRIRNSDDDKLDTCLVYLELRNIQEQCLRRPYFTIIEYGGCTTIPGYPYPCRIIIPRTHNVTLAHDVQQCDHTVQLFSTDYHKSLKLFKWARVFSFCRYINSMYDYGCRTHDCKECLTVCRMDNNTRNVMSSCQQNCTTNACKEGCRFYSKVFINSDVAHNTAIKRPKINYKFIIKDGNFISGLHFSWHSVFSEDTFKIPSLYLVLAYRRYMGKEFNFYTLTESSRHLVQVKDMCRKISLTVSHVHYSGFEMEVIPINFAGPKSYLDAKGSLYCPFIYPVELPSKWSVSKPFFEKSVENNFDYIVWKIDRKGSSNIIDRFRVKYNIYKCPDIEIEIEMKKLNPEKVHLVEEGPFRMRIANTKDDKLDTCAISLELRAVWGGCFSNGKPYNTIIEYSGCETIPGYPTCKDTLIYKFSLRMSAADCVNPFISTCPRRKNITCQFCPTTRHRIKVTWEHPTYVLNITEYTVRWGELIKGVFMDTKTRKLPKSYTSYTIDFSAGKRKSIGIQVHAETPMSKPRWKWQSNVNSIQNRTLEPLEPKPVSPALATTKNEIISPTIIVLIVFLFLGVSGLLALYITYRRRSNLRKKFKRDKIKMDDKIKSGAVDKWEISYSLLTLGKKIGEGAFGNVFCGSVKTIELSKTPYADQCSGITLKKKKVAVKFLKDDAQELEYRDFFEEINLMKDIGFHQNIVNIIGCGTITEPTFLVLEYMNGGDLLNYMRVYRQNKSCTGAYSSKAAAAGNGDDSTENADHLSPHDVMSFSWQIANGMEYLSMHNVVHRDLAARNILISDDKKIKISDFGLSRFVSDELIYLGHNKSRKLPIKWMSIEAIYNQEFTTVSDVWAYGVVLFEMVTLGGTPYPSIGNRELCKILKSGYRMDKPDNCNDTVYHIMLHCWNEVPTERPTFTELRERFEELVEKDETYFSFNIDENKSYYNVASFKSIPSDANDDGDES